MSTKAPKKKTYSIAIIDDHELLRDGVKQLIATNAQYQPIYEAVGVNEAIELLQNNHVDIVLLDLALSDGHGLDVLDFASKNEIESQFIVLSMYDREPNVSETLDAGASAYVSKRAVSKEVLLAISCVIEGGTYISKDVIANMAASEARKGEAGYFSLTTREKGIFKLIADGFIAKDIARQYDIAVKTAHAHRRNIMIKLNCKNESEVKQLAKNLGVVAVDNMLD